MTPLAQRTDPETGWEITLYAMMWGNVRVCVGEPGRDWYERGWCYQAAHVADAYRDVGRWNGDGTPPGRWFKDLQTGQTRDENLTRMATR